MNATAAKNSINLFQGERWFNIAAGVPYWATILGQTSAAGF